VREAVRDASHEPGILMSSGVCTRLRRLILGWTLRQALVALCIAAFLVANVAHAGQHAIEGLLPQHAQSLDTHDAPNTPEPTADQHPAIDVCAACHWVAAPVAMSSLDVPPMVAVTIALTPAAAHDHLPAVDFRPPIA
jgi:hypothetical protein